MYAACGHAGLLTVPLNWHWVAEEIAYVLEDSGAKALIVDPQFGDAAADAGVQRGRRQAGAHSLNVILGEEGRNGLRVIRGSARRATG